MCGPAALVIAATAVAAVGKGVSAIQQSQQASYQAKVADANASQQTAVAADAQQRGQIELKNQYMRASQIKGEQIAAMSSNGIDTSFGSALNVQTGQAQLTQQDALTTSQNTDRDMHGYEVNAANYDAQASADRQKASGALVQGAFDVGSTILGGATQYSKLQNPLAWRAANSGVSVSSGAPFG